LNRRQAAADERFARLVAHELLSTGVLVRLRTGARPDLPWYSFRIGLVGVRAIETPDGPVSGPMLVIQPPESVFSGRGQAFLPPRHVDEVTRGSDGLVQIRTTRGREFDFMCDSEESLAVMEAFAVLARDARRGLGTQAGAPGGLGAAGENPVGPDAAIVLWEQVTGDAWRYEVDIAESLGCFSERAILRALLQKGDLRTPSDLLVELQDGGI